MLEKEIDEALDGLTTPGHQAATVTQVVTTKVSDSEHWGEGTWDKIPYSVEISCSVQLACNQSAGNIVRAQNLAYDLAWAASRQHLGAAVIRHTKYIRTKLYPSLFGEEGK